MCHLVISQFTSCWLQAVGTSVILPVFGITLRMENPIEDIFATENYRLLYFVTSPQGKALNMGQTYLTFIGSSAFKARLEQAEVLKS